jgi:hypothetical protein
MPVALAARTFVAAAYLIALGLHGRPAAAAGLLAVALLGVWAVPLLRKPAAVKPARTAEPD